eukprot:4394769-Ditylum_brightwellii.AAC.1
MSLTSWKSRDPPLVNTVSLLLALQGRIFFKSNVILVQLTLEHVSSNSHVLGMWSQFVGNSGRTASFGHALANLLVVPMDTAEHSALAHRIHDK